MHDHETAARRVAVVVRQLLEGQAFASLGELRAAVKDRCARLRLPYGRGAVDRALDLVASNRPLLPMAAAGPGTIQLTTVQQEALARLRASLVPESPNPSPAVAAERRAIVQGWLSRGARGHAMSDARGTAPDRLRLDDASTDEVIDYESQASGGAQ